MSKRGKTGKLGCGLWLAFVILFIIMISSGVSAKAFFIGIGIFVVVIAVVDLVQEKKKKEDGKSISAGGENLKLECFL